MSRLATLMIRMSVIVGLIVTLSMLSARLRADTGTCEGASVTLPFTDVPSGNVFFCSIAEAFFSGLTNGTTATTYSPSAPVPREQMAAFITRTLEQSLRRGNHRAALNQWWAHKGLIGQRNGGLSHNPTDVVSNGTDIWVASQDGGLVAHYLVKGGDLVDFGTTPATALVAAGDLIYAAGSNSPPNGNSTLAYVAGNVVQTIATTFSGNLRCLAFDGVYIWTGSDSGVIGKIRWGARHASDVITVSTSFGPLSGMLCDGSNIWVTEPAGLFGHIHRLNDVGSITSSVTTGISPMRPLFDGLNIWVPNEASNTVTVVRVKDASGNSLASPFVLATLSGNGLNQPQAAAFDGERVMVTNYGGGSVSVWKAADLTPLGSFVVADIDGASGHPFGICSDGVNFWITFVADAPTFGSVLRL